MSALWEREKNNSWDVDGWTQCYLLLTYCVSDIGYWGSGTGDGLWVLYVGIQEVVVGWTSVIGCRVSGVGRCRVSSGNVGWREGNTNPIMSCFNATRFVFCVCPAFWLHYLFIQFFTAFHSALMFLLFYIYSVEPNMTTLYFNCITFHYGWERLR